jgi:LysM repeat protein
MAWYVMMVGWIDERKPADGASGALAAPNEGIDIFPGSTGLEGDESGAIYHKVQAGQSAWTIALYYQIDIADLLAMNDLPSDAILQPGDLLMIRPPQVPTSTTLSTPRPSATLIQVGPGRVTPTSTQAPIKAEELETPDLSAEEETGKGTISLGLLLGIGGGMVVLMFLYNRLRTV